MQKLATTSVIAAIALSFLPAAGFADPPGGKHGHDKGHREARESGCPPGLAKKHNGCRPPGQAKTDDRDEHHSHKRPGDRIDRDYTEIRNPERYGLDPRYTYWRSNDEVYRVDAQSGTILDLIGAVSALLN
ncbi:excinuclease ABC subunit A [Rhodobacteraceae bacterium]|nr:excinuclease ABC subunit A [Paracoccaceae bacterium]